MTSRVTLQWGHALLYVSLSGILASIFALLVPLAFIPGLIVSTLLFYLYSKRTYMGNASMSSHPLYSFFLIPLLKYIAPVVANVEMTPGDPVTDAAIAALITILIIIMLLQLARQQGESEQHIQMLGIGLQPLVNALVKKIPDQSAQPPAPSAPKLVTPCHQCKGSKFITCPTCGGRGFTQLGTAVTTCTMCYNMPNPPGRGFVTCGVCGGTGIEPPK
jgi:hypothetical protein